MKIHLDLDCYFVSAERTRYPFLKGKNVVVAKGSDKKIFSKEKKEGVIVGNNGAFNSVLEFKNSYNVNNILKEWRDEFIDENGEIKERVAFDPKEIDLMDPKNYAIISSNLYRVQKFAFKDYFFRHHLETTVDDNRLLHGITWKRCNLSFAKDVVKVRVNHIGQIVMIGEY